MSDIDPGDKIVAIEMTEEDVQPGDEYLIGKVQVCSLARAHKFGYGMEDQKVKEVVISNELIDKMIPGMDDIDE